MLTNLITVAYTRVSTLNQLENGSGLEVQKSKIQEYCSEHGYTIEKFYVDEAISGSVKERKELLALLEACSKGLINRIIVYKRDRLSRELAITLWLEKEFRKYNVEVLSVTEPEFDIEDPIGKAFLRIIGIFAELERDMITMRLRDGRVNKAKQGKRGCGAVPYGYVKQGNDIELHPEEARWVEKIFRWRVKGFGFSEIAKKLNRLGLKTRRIKSFQAESVKYILRNGMYFGVSRFGDIQSVGVHQPIISKRLFVKVQRV